MWVEFVVGSLLCSERFFSGYSGFPLSLKTNAFKFQFDLERTDTFQRVVMNSLVLRGWTNYNLQFFFFNVQIGGNNTNKNRIKNTSLNCFLHFYGVLTASEGYNIILA